MYEELYISFQKYIHICFNKTIKCIKRISKNLSQIIMFTYLIMYIYFLRLNKFLFNFYIGLTPFHLQTTEVI